MELNDRAPITFDEKMIDMGTNSSASPGDPHLGQLEVTLGWPYEILISGLNHHRVLLHLD
jgi:hypothetical protein